MGAVTGSGSSIESVRRRNWIAIVVATVLMMFSTLGYAAAFVDEEGNSDSFDIGLAFIGLAFAPFVFIALGFISHNALTPKRVLQSMGLLLVVGLALGLIAPMLGAAVGFGVGGALTLNQPTVKNVLRWRFAAVGFTGVYVLVLLIVASPAGVFTAAVLPLMMIGFADEYAAWMAGRDA